MTQSAPTTELQIELDELSIAALKSVTGTRHKVLCVHGWLDNANSFKPLLPLIDDAEIVAIDLPGHGLSDHCDDYSVAKQAHYILETGAQLGWADYTLIGHSLGGCIAKQTINKLVLVEALGPRAEIASELPERLKKYHKDLSTQDRYRSRLFNSMEEAVSSRLHANRMLATSARLIVERQLQQNNKKWKWRFDPKLRLASSSYLTEEQVQAVLREVTCPTLGLLGNDGYIVKRPETAERIQCISDLEVVTLDGHHHLHLDHPEIVASEVNNFLNQS